ncbi:MAG: glycerol-3-phosphate 1-O-acyltransferase PlsY [Candidatus Margulisiibacteriota bacterium]
MFGSYLLGSIPFSHIFPKLKGKDIKKGGTKNIGASNVLVVAGPFMGALALIGDIAKGYLAVSLAAYYSPNPWLGVFAGIAAIVGHDFSLFLKFKGGKGVATTGGVLIAFDPILAFIVFLLWILLIIVSRYFIPSTLIIAASLPLMMWVLGKRIEFVIFGVLAFVLILYAHREDIKRLISGKELKSSEAIKHYLGK